MLTRDEVTRPKKSRENSILWSHSNSKTSHFLSYGAYGNQAEQDAGYSVVITIEVCARKLANPGITLFPSFFVKKNCMPNVKEAVERKRKACACQAQKCQLELRKLRESRS